MVQRAYAHNMIYW